MSTSAPIRIAMVLAAGYGKRMRPLTNDTPKPMIPVLGEPMIDRVLDHLERAKVATAVVNLHHLGGKLEAHLKDRKTPKIVFSPEDDLLETGGGVRHAIDKLGDKPFYVANSDTVWLDGPTPALERLRQAWDGRRMDALLMLYPTIAVPGYEGSGDYFMDPDGRLTRRGESQVAPFVFTGVQILHPKIFKGVEEGRFSLVRLYDKVQEQGRLFGMRHDGEWYHVGTPDLLAKVERVMTSGPAAREWL
jgi:MurNAc alpha-1-phosphate uridylyltransferase